jgi:predicted ATPase
MLKHISIKGFKSIRELDLDLSPINVLIGANGSGKSNFISFFKLLHWMMRSPGQLQFFVGQSGGANSFLFDGAVFTKKIQSNLQFESTSGQYNYSFELAYAASDTFIFSEEKFGDLLNSSSDHVVPKNSSSIDEYPNIQQLDNSPLNLRTLNLNLTKERISGYRESRLIDLGTSGSQVARNIFLLMQNFASHQFHDTSQTARLKQRCSIYDNQNLKEDAGNLAAFLLQIRVYHPRYYQRIVDTIRQIAPLFADFVLEPMNNTILLQWREIGTDLVFSPHQASDGTLRAMALVTLLLQPPDSLPDVLILDEPELGLHPYAIDVVGSLINGVSNRCQVILATQSPLLVDCFEPEEIIVVERNNRESSFKRLVQADLEDWLEEYSLSELWNKNVIGGRP